MQFMLSEGDRKLLLDRHEDDDDEVDTEKQVISKSKSQLTPTIPTTFSSVRLTVTEGKYRMVRRILHNAGHTVVELHRLRYGQIFLEELEEGEVRPCSETERLWATSLVKRGP